MSESVTIGTDPKELLVTVARLKKAEKIVDVLLTLETNVPTLKNLGTDSPLWARIAKQAKVNEPSDVSIAMVLELYRWRTEG